MTKINMAKNGIGSNLYAPLSRELEVSNILEFVFHPWSCVTQLSHIPLIVDCLRCTIVLRCSKDVWV